MTLKIRPSCTIHDITENDKISVCQNGRNIYLITRRVIWKGGSGRPKLSRYLFDSLLNNGLIQLIRKSESHAIYQFSKELPKEYGATRIAICDIIW